MSIKAFTTIILSVKPFWTTRWWMFITYSRGPMLIHIGKMMEKVTKLYSYIFYICLKFFSAFSLKKKKIFFAYHAIIAIHKTSSWWGILSNNSFFLFNVSILYVSYNYLIPWKYLCIMHCKNEFPRLFYSSTVCIHITNIFQVNDLF